MLEFLLSASVAAQTAPGNAVSDALNLCRAGIGRDTSGEISAIEVNRSLSRDGWTVIGGPVIVLLGMGEPKPGEVSPHHLIRTEYNYLCWVRKSAVHKLELIRKQ